MDKKLRALPAGAENKLINLTGLNTFKEKILEQIDLSTARLFTAEKNDLAKADSEVISEYFATNADITPRTGDVFVISTVVDQIGYEKSSYFYSETQWEAITGNVDASKVILRKDFKAAGNYDGVGNYVKPLKGTADIPGKGISVEDFLTGMFTQTLQPTVTAQPAVSDFALTGAKAVEAGTTVATASFGTAVLSAGTYEYGPATGIVATSYSVDRICVPTSLNATGVATAASGTDNNGGDGFIIGDDTSAGANVVSSLRYQITVAHGEGVPAYNNLGNVASPEVKIASGSKTQTTSAYTPFRKYFYGTSTDKPEITSDVVRALTNSTAAYKAQTLTVNVPAGAARVAIACIASAKGVTKVLNETALNADITGAFVKSTVKVAGANGYAPVDYNIWVFEPAVAFEGAAVLKVTLG